MAELSITVPASHPQFASILALLSGSAPAALAAPLAPRHPPSRRPRRCRPISAARTMIADRSTLPPPQSTRPAFRTMNAFTPKPRRRTPMEHGASGAALTMRPLRQSKRNCALAPRPPCRRLLPLPLRLCQRQFRRLSCPFRRLPLRLRLPRPRLCRFRKYRPRRPSPFRRPLPKVSIFTPSCSIFPGK